MNAAFGAPRRDAIRHSVAVGVGHHDGQPVGGRGGGVNIRRAGVVEREGKDLADLARGDHEGLRRGNQLRLRRPAHAGKTDHPQSGAIEIDVGFFNALRSAGRRADNGRSGKARYRGIACRQNSGGILRKPDRRQEQKTQ